MPRRLKQKENAATPHCSEGSWGCSNYPDPIAFLSLPHTVTVLFSIGAFFLYSAIYGSTSPSVAQNSIRGIVAASTVFVIFGVTQLKEGPFIRPHLAFWRAVQAVSIIYLMLLIFLFYQNVSDARQLLRYIDPSLGVKLPEESYAEDCSLSWSSIQPKIDIFVIAHIIGWYVKSLILRDYWLCWIISVMFEVIEYSLQHQLPNFAECWWDHWILDVFLCNWLGIWGGMKTCQFLAMKTYNWRSIKEIPSVGGKLVRTVEQFTPHSWISFDWAASKTLKGYLVVILLTIFFLVSEVNCFYLKYLLWIPPPHPINLARILLYALMGAVGMRETYQFFTDPACKRLGTQAWIVGIIIIIEALISVKFGRNEFPNPAPLSVVRFWQAFVAILAVFPIWQFWLRYKIFGPSPAPRAVPPSARAKNARGAKNN